MAKGFGVSPITKTIYYGERKRVRTYDNVYMFTGEKKDVTNDVIAVVFEWFVAHMEDDIEEHVVTYPSTEFELVMRRREVNK